MQMQHPFYDNETVLCYCTNWNLLVLRYACEILVIVNLIIFYSKNKMYYIQQKSHLLSVCHKDKLV